MALHLNVCTFIIFCVLAIFIHGNAVAPQACVSQVLFVEDAILIDVSYPADCILPVETSEDRILAFTMTEGTFEEAQDYLTIQDGLEENSTTLLFDNQKVYEVSNKNLPSTIYTTKSTALLRFKGTPNSSLQLMIQKAVTCPFNLGTETQCGRAVDEISCYCAVFTKRTQSSQTSFCTGNQMRLLSIENMTEQEAIQTIWGRTTRFWTSCTDSNVEGRWLWESTNTYLSPGYSNWGLGQPNQLDSEDCMCIGYDSDGAWGDYSCGASYDAICEAQA